MKSDQSLPAFPLLAILLACLLTACSTNYNAGIIGSWQIDSVFDYHSGFTFMDTAPFPSEVHEYRENGTMLRKGMGEVKEYYFTIQEDLLSIRDLPDAVKTNDLQIIKLEKNQLILKKNKRSVFPNSKEIRYEYRYFTRQPQ